MNTETSIDEIWTKLSGVVAAAYPGKAEKLAALTYHYVDKCARGEIMAYDVVEHSILYTPPYYELVGKVGESQDARDVIKMLHYSFHEFMHAISHRKVVKPEGGTDIYIESGFQISRRDAGKESYQNVIFNEFITNFHAYELIRKIDDISGTKEWQEYLDEHQTEYKLGKKIVQLVGNEKVEEAYLEGRPRGFEMALEKAGINSFLLLELLNSGDAKKLSRGFALLGFKANIEINPDLTQRLSG